MRMQQQLTMISFLLSLVLLSFVKSDEESHEYDKGDEVVVWFNKVGPYNNPSETYNYNSLPFCVPEGYERPEEHALGIGEILEGNELIESGQHVLFGIDTPKTILCKQTLNEVSSKRFTDAVSEHYWYQMNVDDLPIWGIVGRILSSDTIDLIDDATTSELLSKYGENTPLIYTHKKYDISFNGPHIIHVNVSYTEDLMEIKEGANLEFTYEVQWSTTTIPFEDRFDKYLEDGFFEHQIHWVSIFNSFMMVIFLCGISALVLIRSLNNDYARYKHDEDSEETGFNRSDDTGWKQIHGDVFRRPKYLSLYCAMIGTGAQLLVLITSLIFISIGSSLYAEPGGIIGVGIGCYALSSFVAGYTSGSLYYQFFYPSTSPEWIQTLILSVTALPGVIFLVIFFINFFSIAYQTTYAIPVVTMLKILLIWAFVSFPLSIFGTLLGRHWSGRSNFPCRINKLSRPIPQPSAWYFKPISLILFTGLLPFGSIFIEIYFIFTSFWNYKFYYVYGFMLLVFGILTGVTMCVTIVSTYFLLNAENYHWQWISFIASGSTAIYVYLYAIYFYLFKTSMSGMLQMIFYFGYMGLFCIAFFVMCGTIGNAASRVFVTRIYRNIKSE